VLHHRQALAQPVRRAQRRKRFVLPSMLTREGDMLGRRRDLQHAGNCSSVCTRRGFTRVATCLRGQGEGAVGGLQPRRRTVVELVSVAGTAVVLSLGLLAVGCKTLSFTRLAPARTRSRRSGVMNSHFRRRFSCARFAHASLHRVVALSGGATAQAEGLNAQQDDRSSTGTTSSSSSSGASACKKLCCSGPCGTGCSVCGACCRSRRLSILGCPASSVALY